MPKVNIYTNLAYSFNHLLIGNRGVKIFFQVATCNEVCNSLLKVLKALKARDLQ